jgi:hypothetical protein
MSATVCPLQSAERKDKAQAVDKAGKEIAELMKKAQQEKDKADAGEPAEASDDEGASVDATATTIDVRSFTFQSGPCCWTTSVERVLPLVPLQPLSMYAHPGGFWKK